MKRGFTLLELIIVIIIIGILATLGFAQYGRMMERSRGAEARMVCGTIRTVAAGYKLERGNLSGIVNDTVGIGNASGGDMIPGPNAGNCTATNYFWYQIAIADPDRLTVTATRCNSTTPGKVPQGTISNTLTLVSNLTAGTDVWGGSGGY